jgi:hypothetical protein
MRAPFTPNRDTMLISTKTTRENNGKGYIKLRGLVNTSIADSIVETDKKADILTAISNGDLCLNNLPLSWVNEQNLLPSANTIKRQTASSIHEKIRYGKKFSVPKKVTVSLPVINPAPIHAPTVKNTVLKIP